MIEEPSINAIYRVVRPQSTYLLERQGKLAPKYLTPQLFAEIYNRQVELLADEFNYLLPEERLVFPSEDTSAIEGYYWRYLPVIEMDCYVRGMRRWSMMFGGYMSGNVVDRLHKFLLLEAASGMYYWGRVNRGVFSRIGRLRVNEKSELQDLSVAFAQPANKDIPEELASKISFSISSGSPMLDLMDCAAGRLDMFVTQPTADLLPVVLTVMQETGGLVCNLAGEMLNAANESKAANATDPETNKNRPAKSPLIIAGNPKLIHSYRELIGANLSAPDQSVPNQSAANQE